MNNLARAYQDVGKLDQALPLFEEALKLSEAKLVPDRPVTLTSMINLANYFAIVKNYTEAESWRWKWLQRIK